MFVKNRDKDQFEMASTRGMVLQALALSAGKRSNNLSMVRTGLDDEASHLTSDLLISETFQGLLLTTYSGAATLQSCGKGRKWTAHQGLKGSLRGNRGKFPGMQVQQNKGQRRPPTSAH